MEVLATMRFELDQRHWNFKKVLMAGGALRFLKQCAIIQRNLNYEKQKTFGYLGSRKEIAKLGESQAYRWDEMNARYFTNYNTQAGEATQEVFAQIPELEFMLELYSVCPQQALKHVDGAFKDFYKGKKGYPRLPRKAELR